MMSDRKVALITGAGSGMGKALAVDLVSKGWNVACVDMAESGQATATSLGDNGAFFKARVEDYDEQARVFEGAFNKWGRIDAACLNAGIVDKFSLYQLQDRGRKGLPPKPNLLCTDVCYNAIIYGTYLAIHFMRQNAVPGGQIVATASAWGHYGCPTGPEYSGAKAAVLEFCRSSAPILMKKDNITMNVVSPGLVKTNLVSKAMHDAYTDEFLTPIENIIAGYNIFLSDPSLNGQFLYCAGSKPSDVRFVPRPPRLNGEHSRIMEVVCEALFVPIHGEKSDLPDAI